jgi:hypothetical protein
MLIRRTFLAALGAGVTMPALAVACTPARARPKKKMAIVTTEWRYGSHAWHMGERFLVGYPSKGQWHLPDLEVVSALFLWANLRNRPPPSRRLRKRARQQTQR